MVGQYSFDHLSPAIARVGKITGDSLAPIPEWISLHMERIFQTMPTDIIIFFAYRQRKLEMKLSGIMILVALLLGGCSRQTAAQRDALESAKPGYLVAKSFCSQCHALPFADQHPPAAWPSVVSRMEAHIQAANKRMPNPAAREAIIAYFQSN